MKYSIAKRLPQKRRHHLYGRKITYMMNSAIGAVKKAVGYHCRVFDPGKSGLRSSDDLSLKLKYEFGLGDPNNNVLYLSIRDDDKEKSVEMCLHEVDRYRLRTGITK